MRFTNLRPWPEGDLVIVMEVGDRWFDLHNDMDFVALEWRGAGTLRLAFAVAAGREKDGQPPDGRYALEFEDVRGLVLEQPPDYAPECSDLFEELQLRAIEEGRGELKVLAGDLALSFTAAGVRWVGV